MICKGMKINSRYETIRRVGGGGIGEVWECKDVVLKRNVALKFLNESYSQQNTDAIKVFQDEACLGASLFGHPNIVAVLDYGDFKPKNIQHSIYYMVMEYINGINLDEWINKTTLNVDVKTLYYINLFIAWEVCKAISYADFREVIHGDIKPLNIFLSQIGIIKISDFGISRFVDALTKTHNGWHSNSPAYYAPEQWKGEKANSETEKYQLGCTLYQLFTGKLPFETTNLVDLMNAHLSTEPVSPNCLNSHISDELSVYILKLMSKESIDRIALWEIYDVIANEIKGIYELKFDAHEESIEVKKRVEMITNFGWENIKAGSSNYKFPDFYEALSEAVQLILYGITNMLIIKVSDERIEEVATSSCS